MVTFPTAVTFSSAAVTSGTGGVTSSSGSGTTTATLNLGGVSNAQTIAVTLFGVVNANNGASLGNVGVQMSVLLGDVNGSGRTGSTDVTIVRSQTVQTPTQSTCRYDVNVSGRIDSTDVTVTRSQTVTSLP